jgi:preprotein translocase subunit SecG
MLYQVIIVIHILLGLGIIGLVLMQHGKGADAGAAFGSASGSVFGAQGSASFLSRTTAIFAGLFFLTSMGLAILGAVHGKKPDIIDAIAVEQVKSDVPLNQSKPSAEEAIQLEKLPEAAVIKEVGKTQESAPALKALEPSAETPAEIKDQVEQATEEAQPKAK